MPVSNPVMTPSTIIIDKISVTRPQPDAQKVAHAVDALKDLCNRCGYSFRATSLYKLDAQIPIFTGTGQAVVKMQLGAWQPGTNAYRVECNPSKLGANGRAELDTLLLSVLGETFGDFVLNGKVTRIDVAHDIVGVAVNDVILRSTYARVHGIYSSTKGLPETIYVGQTGGTAIYDKHPPRGSLQPSRLRIECRPKPKCPGRDLHQIKDPFAKIRVVRTELLKPLVPQPHDFFFDCARVRGIHRALAMLPRPQRLAIKRIVDDPANSLLPPDIWSTWADTLVEAGLLPRVAVNVSSHSSSTTSGL